MTTNRPKTRLLLAYALTFATVGAVVALRWLLDPAIGEAAPLSLLYIAVVVGVWLGGWRLALVAAVSGYIACDYLFIVPRGSMAVLDAALIFRMVSFLAVSGLIIGVGEAMRRAQQRWAETASSALSSESRLKRAEERFLRAESDLEFQKYALDQSAIVAITDIHGTITYVNDKFCEISGYSRDELVGQNHRIINSGLHSREFFREMYLTISQGKVWRGEIRNRRKDGSFYWVDTTIVPFMGEGDTPAGYVAIRTDITERKQVEADLEFQKYALDQSSIVAITDIHGTITYVNDKFCEISGYSREELIGQNHRIINSGLHPQSFFREMYLTISQGKVWRGEIRNRRKDGSFYWVDTTIVPSMDQEGRPSRYVSIRTDITERKQAEESLSQHAQRLEEAVDKVTSELAHAHERQRAAERLVVMGTLSAGLGHDLGNLLLPISVRLDALLREPLPEQALEDLRAIGASIEYLRNALRGLRDLAMDATISGHGELVTDIKEWWSRTLPILRAALPRTVRLESDIPADVRLLVNGSPHQLTQIIFNLVQNAGEAMGQAKTNGGLVRISAERANGHVQILVSDNGPGMSDEVRSRCLDPFFTTKKKALGGGMGLSLVASIVERLHGQISVKSALENGTAFTVTLPAAETAPSDEPAVTSPPLRTAAVTVSDARLRAQIEWTLRAHRVAVFDSSRQGGRINANLWIVEAGNRAAAAEFASREGCWTVVLGETPDGLELPRVLYTGSNPSPIVLRDLLKRALAEIPEQEHDRNAVHSHPQRSDGR